MRHMLAAAVTVLLGAAIDTALAREPVPDDDARTREIEEAVGADEADRPKERQIERQIERMTVTASKREESIEDIPLAVSTVGGDELRLLNAQSFEDYLTRIPGVQFNDGGNTFSNSISIRGVTDGTGSVLTQAPIALYLDETPLTLSQGNINLDYAIFGIEQVTVIKGPHSSLYGAASLGGTIKIETTKPSLTENRVRGGASVSAIRFGDVGYSVFGSVSAVLAEDVLAVEATGYSRRRAGFIDDPSRDAEDINPADTFGGRLAVRFQPTERLLIDASALYQDHDGFQDTFAPGVGDLVSAPLQVEQPDPDEVFLASLVMKYDLGFAELVSATSYFDRNTGFFQDLSDSFGLGFPDAVARFDFLARANVTSQEVRLVSTSDGPAEWLVGGLYYRENYQEMSLIDHSVLGKLFGTPEGEDLRYDYRTLAAFAELSYEVLDRLTFTAGGRVTNYRSEVDLFIEGLFSPPEGSQSVERTDEETVFTPRFAVSYAFDNALLYYQSARGFRQGQANSPVLTVPGDMRPAFFESDSLWNHEIGAKTNWFDRRLQANVAIYYINWTDIQQSVTFSTGFGGVANLGQAEIQGFELESTALLTDTTVWTLGVSYIDAETVDDVPTFADAGSELPGVPDFTFNTGLQQSFILSGHDAFARLDYLYYGNYNSNFTTTDDPIQVNGGYHKLDLRTGVTLGGVDFQIFATNVLDERPVITRDGIPGPLQRVVTIQPRTIGLSINFQY
ncbi:MAG: TonB-dependent receptor [Alphaproteobacteria bacterium]